MQVIESQTMHALVEKLSAISRDLPFESRQAWKFSSHYMASYLQEHADNGTGLSASEAAMMAAARLDWVLRQTRPTLSGLFSERDITVLMDCYQGDMFFPDQMDSIASDLCDHVGVELGAHQTSAFASLFDKLGSLSPVQRVTLADALEQTWHRCMGTEQKQPREFLASMGILLK